MDIHSCESGQEKCQCGQELGPLVLVFSLLSLSPLPNQEQQLTVSGMQVLSVK